ncbi:recombinase family protein [Rhizobium sp. LjRoot254]|uniref:recombinase family protein n=1 Tax=Rhizobium sp. LjRoot254 TaxID=3342297 RepID=UPI003ED10F7F
MSKCFGYVRVSTVKQGEGVSLDAQREAIEHFAARNGITIVKWFVEKETAAKSGRPVFNDMIRLLKRRSADGVVMHKIDRSARNFADWAKIGDLSDAGIDVHFATESLDFRSRGGRLSADIQAVIAADYIRNLREETIKGLTGRLKQGLYPFKAPLGYLNNGGGQLKTIDPVRGPLVKRAFELYAAGRYSLRTLSAETIRLGLRNEHGRPLSKGTVEKMLSNPFYAGVMRIRRTGATYRGNHEPLISVATFEGVQAIKAGKVHKKVTRHSHTYRGLFRCQGCFQSMIPELQKGHIYYRCQQADCPTNCVREEVLEDAVAIMLSQTTLTAETLDAITAAVEKWISKHPHIADIRAITLQLSQLEGRLDQLTDALIDRLIDKETFNRRKEVLLLEQAELEKRCADACRDKASPQMVRRFLERIKNLAEHYIFAPSDEKREIVQIATSNRMVWNKSVYLEPSNWLKETQEALAVSCGGPSRLSSRRVPQLVNEQVAALVDLANSDESARLEEIAVRAEKRLGRAVC